jgi:hypothetical protein
LHLPHTSKFYDVMMDPVLRARLFERLDSTYQSEGLEFFAAVLERNRNVHLDKMAATRDILRTFVLNTAHREVNISSKEKDRLIEASLQEDTSPMLADDFFREPALEACRDVIMSGEFMSLLQEVGM